MIIRATSAIRIARSHPRDGATTRLPPHRYYQLCFAAQSFAAETATFALDQSRERGEMKSRLREALDEASPALLREREKERDEGNKTRERERERERAER